MCKILKLIFIFIVVIGIFVYGYFKLNGEFDIWLCDLCCRNNSQYTQHVTEETKVIGIYKVSVSRCECRIIHKDIEKIFRQEMEKSKYDEKVIDKWLRKLYSF